MKKNLFPQIPSKKIRLKMKKKILKDTMPKLPKSQLAKICYDLWRDCIKERAGWRSEISGTPAKIGKSGKMIGLDSHHIAGKSNYWLRFNLDNGIALDSFKEHINGVHANDPIRSEEYRERVINYIGRDKWEELKALRHKKGRPDLIKVKEYLETKLKEYKNLESYKNYDSIKYHKI